MKKVSKIIVCGLMVTSFQIQFASSSSNFFSHDSGAGAGAGSRGDFDSFSATQQLWDACKIDHIDDEIIAMATRAIEDGANVNQLNLYQQTPLYMTCLHSCNYNLIKLLLNNGAAESINQHDEYDYNSFSLAVAKNNYDIVKLLLDAKNAYDQPALNLQLTTNLNTLDQAINSGKLEIVQAIIKSPSFNRQTVVTAEGILNSLYFIAPARNSVEYISNENYPDLEGELRDDMIVWLQGYIEEQRHPQS